MKKFLIGCGVVVLFLACLVVGLMIFAYIKLKNFQDSWKESITAFAQVDKKYPHTPPGDESLDEERLMAWLAVREAVCEKALANATIQKIVSPQPGQPPRIGFWELTSLGFSFSKELLGEAGAQLDKHQMSSKEFAYISRVLLATVVQGAEGGDAIMGEIRKAIEDTSTEADKQLTQFNKQQGKQNQVNLNLSLDHIESRSIQVPLGNYLIIAKHKDELLKYPGLLILDLILFDTNIEEKGITPATLPAQAVAPADDAPEAEVDPAATPAVAQ